MHPRKRPAAEPILPVRDPKSPRLHKIDEAADQALSARWAKVGREFAYLVIDTAWSLALLTSMPALGSDRVSDSMSSATPTPRNESASEDVHFPEPRSNPLTYTPPSSSNTELPRDSDTPTAHDNAHDSTRTHTDLPTIEESPSPPQKHFEPSSAFASDPSGSNASSEGRYILSSPSRSAEQDSKEDALRAMESLRLDSSSNSLRSSQVSDTFTETSRDSRYSQRSSDRSSANPKSRNRRREHIYARVHDARVRRDRKELREEMAQELYELKRKQGYSSGYQDFKGLLDYQRRLNNLDHDHGLLPTRPFKFKRQLPQTDELDEAFLQRAIERAKATLSSPKPPKPYAPTFEQLLEFQRKRDEAIERRLRPPVPPLPTSLPPEDEQQVSQLLRKRGVISKFAREQVSDQDIARLQPGQWLNDEIINFYGAMILARSEASKENPGAKKQSSRGRKTPLNAHYFSSFFWTKLTEEGYEKGRLAKWTKKIDIFSKDVILIPVNHGNSHWTAAAINFRQKRIESYDSMNMAKERVFKALRRYVNDEHMNKKKKPFDFTGWTDWAPETTPQQENGYDCGVFTCQFLESLSRGEENFNFSQKDMRYLRRRMIWEIGNAKLRDDP
ncbi:hypothetical protein CVT26_013534 [Gymnopilus dilepis]|uniref:Ubiquitin-like protease family profile domain-containing protein n=1 Tax=Gymnopilus dilepis TaxID=231916 RepID=A0A409Y5F3_9AGAR|nr:hypothetical protein CVT26_013534 [Gymnopilus dilepis]